MKIGLKKNSTKFLLSALRYLILIGLSFLIIYPLAVTVLISFMQSSDIYDSAVRFIPKSPTFQNYIDASIFLDYWKSTGMSVLLNTVLCLVEMAACLIIAYGFARFEFPFKKLLFGCVILTLLVPYSIYFTPLYFQLQNYGPFGWNLLSTPLPMFLLSATGVGLKDGLVIYIMCQSFKGYPKELEEAASVDGAGTVKVFTRIMLPGAAAVFFTCFMFVFVWKWTDPTYSELFFPNTEFIWSKLATIEQQFELAEEMRSDYYLRAILKNASIVMFIAPLMVLFMFTKRFLVESIETTGIVG